MRQIYAVVRSRGPAWQSDLPMERQPGWAAHATFMNSLSEEGLVILGGPLEGTNDVLLVVQSESPEAIRLRLEEDPWTREGLLRIDRVAPWTLRLGSLP